MFPIIYDGVIKYIKYVGKFFIQFYQIWIFVRKKKYDLCIISVAVLLWPAIILKLLNYKTIIFVKETIEPELFRKILYKTLSFSGCYFIPNSNIIRNEFVKITGNENIETVYSSVEEKEYIDLSDQEYEPLIGSDAFHYLNRSDNLKLLIVGNFTKIKNNILAAETVFKLKAENGIDCSLFIVGSTEIDKKCSKQFINYINQNNILGNIFLLGPQNKNVLSYLYKHVDIFIIPSLSEGIPLVLVYALKYKTPIISAKVGGIPDVIENNVNGILVNPNINSLANAILEMINNEGLRDKLVSNGFITYQEKFNLQKNLNRIENIIDNALHCSS